ncbi:chitinase [Lasiosphaeria ovina]|uniref:Chitinase n=1 Tax=Lasiosphaeria ovina TaxID=92902 RepID=A0AAE0K2E5_9PEZI|nr:chitinase [Lasiosphaeria ovina]
MKWAFLLVLTWALGLGQAAIQLDGTQAVEPATSDEDPSPIANINTYHPDQHDCPLPCTDYANTHGWISYHTVQRLRRCAEPMLLQLAVSQTELEPVESPKKSDRPVLASLDVAPACFVDGTEVEVMPEVSQSSHGRGRPEQIEALLEGLGAFFKTPDNCDENILFACHNQTVAGVYIGAGLGKPIIASALDALAKSIGSSSSAPARTVVQLCGRDRQAERVLGIAIESDRNLALVRKSVLAWSKGIRSNSIWAAYRYIKVQSGDGFASLASRCGIPGGAHKYREELEA